MRLAEEIRLPRMWNTAAAALAACAGALGDRRGPFEVAAASGLAFRITLDAQLTLGGPHAWPWREELSRAAERLGFACEVVASDEPPGSALHAAAQERALTLIRRGLATGRPTLIWGVHAPEFGIARGLHGDTLEVSGILDGVAPGELPASALGRGDAPVVFALQLTQPIDAPEDERTVATLRSALVAGRGPTPCLAGFSTGLAAWRTLDAALERGDFDPAGLAYLAQRQAESRAAAAGWLDGAEARLGVDLRAARAAFRRSAGMLAELAACHPFPPPPGTMVTNTARDEARALVDEVAKSEASALGAIEAALAVHARRRTDALQIFDLSDERRPALFACTAELPIGLAAESTTCRERATLRAKLLYDGARPIGHLYYAPLEDAHYPIFAEGRRWFLFCPWLQHDLRGRGLGQKLFAALDAEARSAGIDGLLTIATTDERFLYPAPLEKHGFVPVERRGELVLLERVYTDVPSRARLWDPPAVTPGSALPVRVRQAYNCPLLLHTRLELTEAAHAENAALDLADATATDPAGATIAGKPLLHGFVPLAALTAALRDERARW